MAKRVRSVLLGLIAVLYVVSIPWYRTAGAEPELILGFPDWAAVAIACYVGVAILNSIAWLLTEPEPDDEAGE